VSASARLATIRIHPIKSLDGVSVREARIGVGGGLELDRVWALYSSDDRDAADDRCINGKRSAAIHLIRATFAPDLRSVVLSVPTKPGSVAPRAFAFPDEFAVAAEWFSEYFAQPVVVRYVPQGAPDDTVRNGPMVISTATLQEVCDWFPGIDLEESRRRFRTPLELGGVPAFWEDRLYREDEGNGVHFTIGDVAFEGTNPCPRCAVPARDALTGVGTDGFQKAFAEHRRARLPSWAPAPRRITHSYHLGVNTRVAVAECGKSLRVGDVVRLAGE
jgi:uncharacterized protein YcbX